MQFIISPWTLLGAAPLVAARYSPLPLRVRADGCPLCFNGTTVTVTEPAPTCAPVTIARAGPTETVTATVTATVTVTVTQTPAPQQPYAVSKASATQPQLDPCEEPADVSLPPEQPHRLYITKTIIMAPHKFKQPETVTIPQSTSAAAPNQGPATAFTVQPVPVESPLHPEKFETVVKTVIHSPEPPKEPATVTFQPEKEVEPLATVVFGNPCPSVMTSTATAFNTVLVTVGKFPNQNTTAVTFSSDATQSSDAPVQRCRPVQRCCPA